MKSKAKQIAEKLRPEDGWFHDPATTDDIRDAVQTLINAGASVEKVELAIGNVIYTVMNEYGE